MSSESNSFVSEWKTCFSNRKLNLIEKCLKLAQILEYPNLDITKEIEKIHDLGITLKNSIVESKNSTYKIYYSMSFCFKNVDFMEMLTIIIIQKTIF